MTEQQKAYHERQEALKAAQEVVEQSSDEIKASVKMRYDKARVSLSRLIESKPQLVQKHFPKLLESPGYIGSSAASFIGWSDTHESIAIYNHHDGIFHYEKVREKFEWAQDEHKNKLRDEKGQWIKIGRRGGDKWIAGYGEKYGNAFPIDLFNHLDNFGTIIQTGVSDLVLAGDSSATATVKIEPGASYLIASDAGIATSVPGRAALINEGRIAKTGGLNTSTLAHRRWNRRSGVRDWSVMRPRLHASARWIVRRLSRDSNWA
jgi:hypothetical protein